MRLTEVLNRSRRTLLLAVAALALAGCSSTTMTNPPRSVTEQLLLSTAADRAIKSISLAELAHKKVFVDQTYFESYDSKYVIGTIRDALSQAGAHLMTTASNSEIIVEARGGGLSVDASDTLVGIAQTGLPIPLAGTLNIPELSVYKSTRQRAIAKLALLAYTAQSRDHVLSTGAMVGKSYNKYYKLLGIIQWTTTDIPEKKNKKSEHPAK
jgi:hypothetical protein